MEGRLYLSRSILNVHPIGLVQDEADLLVLAAAPPQHLNEILIEVLSTVLVVDLDLEDR